MAHLPHHACNSLYVSKQFVYIDNKIGRQFHRFPASGSPDLVSLCLYSSESWILKGQHHLMVNTCGSSRVILSCLASRFSHARTLSSVQRQPRQYNPPAHDFLLLLKHATVCLLKASSASLSELSGWSQCTNGKGVSCRQQANTTAVDCDWSCRARSGGPNAWWGRKVGMTENLHQG